MRRLLRAPLAGLLAAVVVSSTACSVPPSPAPTPAAPTPGRPGPLGVDPSGHFLVEADGTPFVWQGDTAWTLISRTTREDVTRYLDARERQGFNVVLTVAMMSAEQQGSEPNVEGVAPHGGTVASPNEAYFAHADYVIDEAEKRGLRVALLPIWMSGQVGKAIDASNAEGYGEWIGRRYADRNLIWVMGGDSRQFDEEVTRLLAKGVTRGVAGSEDHSKVMMTYHPGSPQQSAPAYHDDPWLDFNMNQSSHCPGNSAKLLAPSYARTPPKPVIDGEPLYEDHLLCWNPDRGYSTAQQVRNQLYGGVFAGGFGLTYGHHAVWQLYRQGRTRITGVRVEWTDALDAEVANQAIHLRRLLESRPTLARVPDQSVITNPMIENLSQQVLGTRGGDGSYLFVYTGAGTEVQVDLSKLSGDTARIFWFDPRTGTSTPVGEQPSEGVRTFTPPSDGDWVLVADDASRGFGTPGQPT